jgi:hypothetical protein
MLSTVGCYDLCPALVLPCEARPPGALVPQGVPVAKAGAPLTVPPLKEAPVKKLVAGEAWLEGHHLPPNRTNARHLSGVRAYSGPCTGV